MWDKRIQDMCDEWDKRIQDMWDKKIQDMWDKKIQDENDEWDKKVKISARDMFIRALREIVDEVEFENEELEEEWAEWEEELRFVVKHLTEVTITNYSTLVPGEEKEVFSEKKLEELRKDNANLQMIARIKEFFNKNQVCLDI